MKHYLLATVSTLAFVGAACAADRPVYTKAAAAPAPQTNWSGPYAGLNIGALRHHVDAHTQSTSAPPGPTFNPGDLSATAATLGGQLGYNWQQGKFVYGLEADLNWTNANASGTRDQTFGGFPTEYSSKLSWYGTARVRAGVTLSPTLLYLTGGLAFGGIRDQFLVVSPPAGASKSRTRVGWTAGAGIEHFIAPNVTVKLEALYLDFGSRSISQSAFGGATLYTGHFKNKAIVGRLGVNVRW